MKRTQSVARISGLAALVLVSFACTLGTGSDSVEEPAVIIFVGDTARIEFPDTVPIGMDFEVRIGTFAGGCTREIARTVVRAAVGLVEIRPYNRRRVRTETCSGDLLLLEHRAQVRIGIAGPATIRLVGEKSEGSGGLSNGTAQLERSVFVR